jgi:hypothetical protein
VTACRKPLPSCVAQSSQGTLGARAYVRDGVVGADARLLDVAVALFDTRDARAKIGSYLDSGPGHATYEGN